MVVLFSSESYGGPVVTDDSLDRPSPGHTNAVSPSQDQSEDLWSFEFFGYMRRVPTTDSATLELLSGPRPRLGGNADNVQHFDGVVWGRGETTFAGHTYDSMNRGARKDWEYFHADTPTTFPQNTFLFGRTATFLWYGHVDNQVTIHRTTGADPRHEAALHTFEEMIGFTLRPEQAFRRFAVRGREGNVFANVVEHQNGDRSVRYSFHVSNNIIHQLEVWRDPHGGDPLRGVTRWRYEIKNSTAKSTTVLDFQVKCRSGISFPKRNMPNRPEDVPATHSDVDGVQFITFFDYSGLGEWSRGNVHFGDTEGKDRDSMAVAMYLAAVIALVTARYFFLQHTQWRHSQ